MFTTYIRISIILGIIVLLARCAPPLGPEVKGPPAAPVNLTGETKDEAVELSWDANTEPDLEGYNLYRTDSSFSDVSEMDPVNGSSLIDTTGYADSGLQNGTTYYYRLTAVDDSLKESDVSDQVEVTPFSDPPDRP